MKVRREVHRLKILQGDALIDYWQKMDIFITTKLRERIEPEEIEEEEFYNIFNESENAYFIQQPAIVKLLIDMLQPQEQRYRDAIKRYTY